MLFDYLNTILIIDNELILLNIDIDVDWRFDLFKLEYVDKLFKFK